MFCVRGSQQLRGRGLDLFLSLIEEGEWDLQEMDTVLKLFPGNDDNEWRKTFLKIDD